MNTNVLSESAYVVWPNQGRTPEPLDVLGVETLVKIAGRDVGDRAAMFHLTVPSMAGPPLHRHSREDEWFYVLDGEITIEIDGRRFEAGPGCTAYAARGTAHAFQNFRSESSHMLVTVAPAGLDRFFAEISSLNRGLPTPDFEGVERLMKGYGLELLGPPLA